MRLIPLFLLFSFSIVLSPLKGQNVFGSPNTFQLDSGNAFCMAEVARAENDFFLNKYTLKLPKPVPFSNSQQKVLKSKYGIDSDYPDLFFDSYYNYHLKKLIRLKFKEDVLSISKTIADSLDEAGLGTRCARFRMKDVKTLHQYLQKALNKRVFKSLERKYLNARVYVWLEIDSRGVCTISELTSNMHSIYEPVFLRSLNGKKIFYPATEEGIPITTLIGYSFTVN